MKKMAQKLMLAVLVTVAPVALTGCGLLDALLAADPGGTGAGPVAAHPQGGGNTAAKVGGILTAIGGAMQPRQPQSDPSGFFPGQQIMPGVTSMPQDESISRPQSPAGRLAPPTSSDSGGATDAEMDALQADPNKVARDLPRKSPGSVDSGTMMS